MFVIVAGTDSNLTLLTRPTNGTRLRFVATWSLPWHTTGHNTRIHY
jgi:hypothetical protein